MAKHQLRSTKEPKKPKKAKQVTVVSTTISPLVTPAKPSLGHKTRH
ncbi:hypothetical protein [Crenobacter cavernae]|nr:hypothetical protein [Crenobacter cavernae]